MTNKEKTTKTPVSGLSASAARKKAIAGMDVGQIETLDGAAEEIEKLTAKIGGDATREMWSAVGAALWRARDLCPTSQAFGAWIVASGIHKKPGLATPSSRSDCIWLVERQECADHINFEITHPRRVRAAWRKFLKETATTARKKLDAEEFEGFNSKDGWVPPYTVALDFIIGATDATVEEAAGALEWATKAAATAEVEGALTPAAAAVKALDGLSAALAACAGAGVKLMAVLEAVQHAYGEGEFDEAVAKMAATLGMEHVPGSLVDAPVEDAMEADHAGVVAEETVGAVPEPWASIGAVEEPAAKLSLVYKHLQAEAGLTFPEAQKAAAAAWYVSADMAQDAMRDAMSLAKEKAITIDEVKDAMIEVFLK